LIGPTRRTRAGGTRVLVDLSHAADGYVGVAQDARLIFAMLCGLGQVEVSGLLMPTGRHDLPLIRPGARDKAALTASVINWMERVWSPPAKATAAADLLRRLRAVRQMARLRHHLLPLTERGQLNAIWRVLFAKTLAPDQRNLVLGAEYYATDLSVSGIIDFCVHTPRAIRKRLDVRHADAVLFCMPRPVQLPRGVRQIMRFHDAVPVTDADTVASWKMALAHARLLRACAPDALFVCNSPQSRDTLISLDPARAPYATVIPCAVVPKLANLAGILPHVVMQRHATFRALGQPGAQPESGWSPPDRDTRYILSVSTLEPRKNFSGLIRAWERVVARGDADLRLVIVGEAGWHEANVLADMRAGVASGRILHLQHLPQEDLQALMHGAACFAFPSFNEGFGYTPLEALQAGTPCLVSDLPVFRWIFGESALYADPYDTNSIASGIERLVSAPDSAGLAASLVARADAVLERFRPATVAKAWESMLRTL
jgi:hypothetical protein